MPRTSSARPPARSTRRRPAPTRKTTSRWPRMPRDACPTWPTISLPSSASSSSSPPKASRCARRMRRARRSLPSLPHCASRCRRSAPIGTWPAISPRLPRWSKPMRCRLRRSPCFQPIHFRHLPEEGFRMNRRLDNDRTIRAPRGSEISAKSWLTEAPLRMLMNNLDPDVAERPSELVVYGGIGRAARDWESFDRIVASLRELEDDQTLLVQSGKPVGVFRTHADAPRVLIANSNIVPPWATLDHFNELDRKGLMMYGQMTAGSWIYIGSQGIVQGTYETFVEVGRRHYGGSLAGKWILTAGLGGMGGGPTPSPANGGGSELPGGMPPGRDRKPVGPRPFPPPARGPPEGAAVV